MKNNFNLEVDIIGIKPYNFTNDDTGEVVSGLKVSVSFDSGKEDNFGADSCKINRPYSELDIFKNLKYPCKAILNFSVDSLDKGGKLVFNSLKPVNNTFK